MDAVIIVQDKLLKNIHRNSIIIYDTILKHIIGQTNPKASFLSLIIVKIFTDELARHL